MTTTGAATVALDLLPKAREVWRMMAEGDPPLMAQPAVDMLLDETDGAAHRRGECVRLLWAAAGEWLESDKLFVYGCAAAYRTVAARAAMRGAASVVERFGLKTAKSARLMIDTQPTWPGADTYFASARRIRTAARLVRDLKRCL